MVPDTSNMRVVINWLIQSLLAWVWFSFTYSRERNDTDSHQQGGWDLSVVRCWSWASAKETCVMYGWAPLFTLFSRLRVKFRILPLATVIGQVWWHFGTTGAPALSCVAFDPSSGASEAGGCWYLWGWGCCMESMPPGMQMVRRPHFTLLSDMSHCPINGSISLFVGRSSKKKPLLNTYYRYQGGHFV